MPNNLSKIEPHAAKLEMAASAMDAAGIGGHPTRGHAAILRSLAADMRSQAALGRMPSVFESFNAAADQDGVVEIGAANQNRSLNRSRTLLEVVNAASSSKDDQTLGRLATLRQRCSRLGLNLDESAAVPLTIHRVDAAFAKGTGSTSDKIAVKSALFREGLLSATGL